MPTSRETSRRQPSKQRRRHELQPPASKASTPSESPSLSGTPNDIGGIGYSLDPSPRMHERLMKIPSPRLSELCAEPRDFHHHHHQQDVSHRSQAGNSLYIPPHPASGLHAPYAAYKLHMQRTGANPATPLTDGMMGIHPHSAQGARHGSSGRHGSPAFAAHDGLRDSRRGPPGAVCALDVDDNYPLAGGPAPRYNPSSSPRGRVPAGHVPSGGPMPVIDLDMKPHGVSPHLVEGAEAAHLNPDARLAFGSDFFGAPGTEESLEGQTEESLSFLANGQEDSADGPGFQALLDLARENMLLKQKLRVAHQELSRLQESVNMHQAEYSKQHQKDQESQSRYWTVQEHQRFIDAIQNYGPKDVKMIASYVGTRNATQVRTHAQKYFIKLARQGKTHNGNNGNDGDNSSSGEASTCSRSNISCSNMVSSSTNFETGPSNSDSTSSNMSGYEGGTNGGMQSSSNSLHSSASPEDSNASSSPFNKEEGGSSGSEGGGPADASTSQQARRSGGAARGWGRARGGGDEAKRSARYGEEVGR